LNTLYLVVGHISPLFEQYFKRHRIHYFVLKDVKRYKKAGDHAQLVDFADKDALWTAVGAVDPRPTCVLTMYEQYIPIAAEINERLELTHALSPEAARAATDKILMREAFVRSSKPISVPFTLVASEQHAVSFAKEHGFPLILKPANLSKSLLVTRCNTLEQLKAAWKEASAEAPRLYRQFTDGLEPRFILEKFMPGSVHTVMGFADKDGTPVVAQEIVDNVTAKEAGYDDSFIFSRAIPSRLDTATQEALLGCTRLGMQALSLRSCAAHAELIVTEDGPRLIEIGARVGGYRTAMYGYASGLDVIGSTLAAYRGELPDLTATKHEHYRAIELFPHKRGAFKEATYFEKASKLPSVISARLKCQPGQETGKAAQGFKAAVVFELHHASAKQIEADYEFIQKNVQVLAD
jgi:biotin carboxylase